MNQEKIGGLICQLRQERGMTQQQLADRLGISNKTVSKWENGTGVPSIDDLLNMSEIFHITIEELLCLDKKIDVNPDDIFAGHERLFVVRNIVDGNIKIDIPANFYRFSQTERMMLLKAIKDGMLTTDMENLKPRLTPAEQKFMRTEVTQ